MVHTNHSYSSKQVAIRQQVIKPLYDTKPLAQILGEMAPHLGIGKYFNFPLSRNGTKPLSSHWALRWSSSRKRA